MLKKFKDLTGKILDFSNLAYYKLPKGAIDLSSAVLSTVARHNSRSLVLSHEIINNLEVVSFCNNSSYNFYIAVERLWVHKKLKAEYLLNKTYEIC